MNILKQFLWILFFSLIGEMLHIVLPLPIPASIYGLLLLFGALLSGRVKRESVAQVANYLLTIMPVLFIPAGVGLMTSWDVLRPILLPVLIITEVVLIAVFAATGLTAQALIRHEEKKR